MSELVRPGVPGALPGKSGSPPLHSHKAQTECFTVKWVPCWLMSMHLVEDHVHRWEHSKMRMQEVQLFYTCFQHQRSAFRLSPENAET